MRNIDNAETGIKSIDTLKQNAPLLKFWIQNYHHGNKNKKVNTHYGEELFRFYEWVDTSPDSCAFEYIKSQRLTRMTFHTHSEYTPQARQSYEC